MILICAALLLGYLVGLLTFKVKSRWCANCGAVKGCPRCAGWTSSARLPFSGTPSMRNGGRRA